MPIKKPKQGYLLTDNIIEPRDFDLQYDSLKGMINGDLDRENVPEQSIDGDDFDVQSFTSVYQKYFKMDEDVTSQTFASGPAYYRDTMCGQTYETYSSGFYTSERTLDITTIKEGMLIVEFSCYYWINTPALGGAATLASNALVDNQCYGFIQMQLTHNGSVIAATQRQSYHIQNLYMCAAIPVQAGTSSLGIRWKFTGRRTRTSASTGWPLDNHYAYWSGGNMTAINRYR
tara:strand:- start:344 stop:1036 length:693 start_codon:yes stop_codon:yes gene_type:complete